MNHSERTCSCCGKRLEGISTDMAYRRPVHYFKGLVEHLMCPVFGTLRTNRSSSAG